MKNLKQLLTKPLQAIPKKFFVSIFILALVGFADAMYLTIEHYQNKIPPCSIGGCETVLTSQYADVMGIPVSLIGAVFYLFVLVMLLLYRDTGKSVFLRLSAFVSIFSGAVAIVLVGLMFFVIKSICVYCMVSDSITLAMAIAFLWLLIKNKNNESTV